MDAFSADRMQPGSPASGTCCRSARPSKTLSSSLKA